MVQKSRQQGVPVIDIDGQIVVGFDRARLERILAAKRDGKVTLGAAIADASKIAMKQGLTPVFGALIGRVSPGSVAARAGLKEGDIITQIGLRPVYNADQVEEALKNIKPGSRVPVEVTRGNKQLQTELSF